MEEKKPEIKISVRNLVEFILRFGDIEASTGRLRDMEAMREGSRIHRKIQKQMGSTYRAEVSLNIVIPLETENNTFNLNVDGRADGIFTENKEFYIDEIKGVYMDLGFLEDPMQLHLAQAKCYAYIYAQQNDIKKINVQMTYCNMEDEDIRRFRIPFTMKELEIWFNDLICQYTKWADWELTWKAKSNKSIKELIFPFEYRNGQKKLVNGVYQTILRNKKLFIEAPTGVGKTISTVYPSLKAMGEGIVEKGFYLTAKTITRTVAEDTFSLLNENGLELKVVTLTAKDKICIFDEADCNPLTCERAKGHFDRVNDAVFEILNCDIPISREVIMEYATKYKVCPFEMALDVSLFADFIICDYNYVFDPHASLKRFFMGDKKRDYVFLIDEAHNLVDRACKMYSAKMYKNDYLAMKRIVAMKSKKLLKHLDICNTLMLGWKRECEEYMILDDASNFIIANMRLMTLLEEFLKEHLEFDGRKELLQFYFDLRHLILIAEYLNKQYVIYVDYDEKGFFVNFQCLDPSTCLSEYLDKGKSAIFFSATLLPVKYYMEQLGGKEEDYTVYAPSPFDIKNRLLMIATDINTKYTNRNENLYGKIAAYVVEFTKRKVGNYLVFFPSYQMLKKVYESFSFKEDERIIVQNSIMSENEKEEFLEQFVENPETTKIGFCVMGGIFGEGIDLKKNRLIGAVIVGTGLPMVCNEKVIAKDYYDEHKNKGFEYAYLYPGMNKVLQAAGRVIRTNEDRGAILLLDDRFLKQQYQELFPREWFPYEVVNFETMKTTVEYFWRTT